MYQMLTSKQERSLEISTQLLNLNGNVLKMMKDGKSNGDKEDIKFHIESLEGVVVNLNKIISKLKADFDIK